MRLARCTLHAAPRSGPRFKEAYKELVWLASAGHVQHAVTQAYNHLAVVTASHKRAQIAREFLQGTLPKHIAHVRTRPFPIHQAAAFIDESVPVLRRWEASGLVSIPRNPKNKYRTYGTNELGWLLVIQSLRLAGYTMASCSQFINQYLQADGGLTLHSSPPEHLYKAIDTCISLFTAHEQHTHTVLDHLHRMTMSASHHVPS